MGSTAGSAPMSPHLPPTESPSIVITTCQDLSKVAIDRLRRSSTSYVTLAELDRTSTGAYANVTKQDGQGWYQASDEELVLWRRAFRAMAGRTYPLDVLEIHSTAQWDLCDGQRSWGKAGIDGSVHVRNFTLSGIHEPEMEWIRLLDVRDRVTLRGCRHLFSDGRCVFLASLVKTSPRTLHLIGGQDMDSDNDLRWCLVNIAITQRNRVLSGMEPFKEVIMQFPIRRSKAIEAIMAAWNDFPPEYRAGATLRVDDSLSDEYQGPRAEESRYRRKVVPLPVQDQTLSGTKDSLCSDLATVRIGATSTQDSERESHSEVRHARHERRTSSESDVERCRHAEFLCGCHGDTLMYAGEAIFRHPYHWVKAKDKKGETAEMRLTLKVLQVGNQYFGHTYIEIDRFEWLIKEDLPDEEKAKLEEEDRKICATLQRQAERAEQKRRKRLTPQQRLEEDMAAAEKKRREEEAAEQKSREKEEVAEQKRRGAEAAKQKRIRKQARLKRRGERVKQRRCEENAAEQKCL